MIRSPSFLLPLASLAACLATIPPASGQGAASAGSALLTLEGERSLRTKVITVSDGNLIVTARNGSGTIGIPVDTVKSIQFEIPPSIQTADTLYGQGKYEEALALYLPALPSLAPFTQYPENNVADSALRAIDAQRQLGQFDAVSAAIDSLPKPLPPATRRIVDLYRVAVLIDSGETIRAREAFDDLATTPLHPSAVGLNLITEARLALAANSILEAQRILGHAIGLLSLNNPHFPEALALAYRIESGDSPYAAILQTARSTSGASAQSGIKVETNPAPLLEFLTYCYSGHHWSRSSQGTPPTQK